MFETAELGRSLDKAEHKAAVEELRTELLAVQAELARGDFPVIVLIHGVDGAGRGDVIHVLNEWLDTRGVATVAFDAPTEEESHRPPFWRYWMALPRAGRMAIFTSAWYTRPIVDRAYGRIDDVQLDAALAEIARFEKELADGGALIIKVWLHISKKQQGKRFRELESDAATRWRVTATDRKNRKRYDEFRAVCEHAIRETSTSDAPWEVVDAADARYRDVTVGRLIAARMRERLAQEPKKRTPQPEPATANPDTILDRLDCTLKVDKEVYKKELGALEARLSDLGRRVRKKNLAVTLVFEGQDAAGKGGAIRRVTGALDPRQYAVIQVAAPTDEEKAHHYLWRFWRHMPRLGRFTIYDRSWYGRVLVERVEGFAPVADWTRAYKEINDFERQITQHGVVLVKLWLHISEEEQLRRFKEREATPWKQYKITADDYRNRGKAHQYESAANEMIERTSTEFAPWKLVVAEDKRYARLEVMRTVCEAIERALDSAK
jgi:AMP-polyphosphate phosphotransferase